MDQYFRSFSSYLRSGELTHLQGVFPQAGDPSFAAVYRNGFFNGCIGALRSSYPVVDRLVGEAYFDFLAKSYVELNPPSHRHFTAYGETFPHFLEQRLEQHQLNYLSDFARLDRAWLSAYFAPDSMLLSAADVERWQAQGRDIGDLDVCLPQATVLLASTHQISTLWSMLKAGDAPAEKMRVEAETESLLIWRDAQDRVNVRVLSDAERAFIAPLFDGACLSAAAGNALAHQADFAVIDFFSELLEHDLLALK